MVDHAQQLQEEIEKLTGEIEDFKEEKERVRAIVGQIGGIPMLRKKVFEIIFVAGLILCLILPLFSSSETVKMIFLDLAVAMVSLKLLYMIRNQARVSHFQLWILSSIEWRLSELRKELKSMNDAEEEVTVPDNS